MADKYQVELDESFVKKLYSLNNKFMPDGEEITTNLLKKQLFDAELYVRKLEDELTELKDPKNKRKLKSIQKANAIKHKVEEQEAKNAAREEASTSSTSAVPSNQYQSYTENKTVNDNMLTMSPTAKPIIEDRKPAILIIDDLGIITYQLSVLFQKQNFIAVQSKEIYEAINTFKKHSFDFVVMDLFIPTEREGFILLDELKKISTTNNTNTIIGVMSASAKKVYKQLCAAKGATFYVEKIDSWQNDLIQIVLNFLNK